MRTQSNVLKKATGAAIALALGSAALSVNMALASGVGTFQEGHSMGERNGTLIVDRVREKTIEKYGCGELVSFQNALHTVAARIRAPRGRGTAFTAGFFQGYLSAVKKAVRQARQGCKQVRFSDGLFPGALLGSVYCQAAIEDADVLARMQASSIYDGWSENAEARDVCDIAFSIFAGDCGVTGAAAEQLAAAQLAACSDSVN